MPSDTANHFIAAVFEISLVTASFEQVRNFSCGKIKKWADDNLGQVAALELPPEDQSRITQILSELLIHLANMVVIQKWTHRIGALGAAFVSIICLGLLYTGKVEEYWHYALWLLSPAALIFGGDILSALFFWLCARRPMNNFEYLSASYNKGGSASGKTDLKEEMKSFSSKVPLPPAGHL